MAATVSQNKSIIFPFENPEEWKRIEDALKSKISTIAQLEVSDQILAISKC